MWETPEYIKYYLKQIEIQAKTFSKEDNSIGLKFYLYNLPLLLFLKKPLKHSKILDIGGGGGDNYFKFRGNIHNNSVTYFLADNKKLFDATEKIRRNYSNPADTFIHVDKLEEISRIEIDSILIIGTLQYLSDIELESMLDDARKIQDIFISRTPITPKSLKTIQLARIPQGEDVKIEVTEIYLRSRRKLKTVFKRHGYKMKNSGFRLPYFLETKQGKILSYYQMIHFCRHS
jgi:putative methyltransferase (TIGR04325 family)